MPSRFLLSMEQRGCAYPRKSSSAVRVLAFLLICSLLFSCAQCQEKMIKESSTQPPWPSRSPAFKIKFQRIILSISLGIITGLIFSLLFALLVRWFVRYINRTPILKGPVVFSPKIPPKTLHLALANETQLLGSSPNGKYYKAILDNGLTIAVKRLEPFEPGSPEAYSKSVKRRIQQELEMLASLRHRNLMSLRAYIREFDRFCLVYDYVPTGSLEDAMSKVRDNQLQLNWEVRLRIAIGIVKGLQYLHFSCNPRILHYNLKPTNIMLDAESEPRLADCGLAKIIPNFNRPASGYSAPESFQNCRYCILNAQL